MLKSCLIYKESISSILCSYKVLNDNINELKYDRYLNLKFKSH